MHIRVIKQKQLFKSTKHAFEAMQDGARDVMFSHSADNSLNVPWLCSYLQNPVRKTLFFTSVDAQLCQSTQVLRTMPFIVPKLQFRAWIFSHSLEWWIQWQFAKTIVQHRISTAIVRHLPVLHCTSLSGHHAHHTCHWWAWHIQCYCFWRLQENSNSAFSHCLKSQGVLVSGKYHK